MIQWLLSLIMPAITASKALKRPLETLSTTSEGVDNPMSK